MYVGLSESGLCVFPVLCPISFIVVGESIDFLMLSLCVILHTMWSGKSLQLICIFPFGMLFLSAISMFKKLCWQCVCWSE